MILVIDASNIKAGGGLTHLYEILESDEAVRAGYKKVYLWAPDKTLEKVSDKNWLMKCNHPWLNGSYFQKLRWKKKILEPFVKNKKSLLFIPGTGSSRLPFVTMCQNLLPIDKKELNRYFISKGWFRLLALRILHFNAYQKAKGVIFLNNYCNKLLPLSVSKNIKNCAVIAHGLNKRFLIDSIKEEKNNFSHQRPFKLLYVSTVDLYKHQWQVADAVYQLIREGYHITLDLIGTSLQPALKKLNNVMSKNSDLAGVVYHGSKPYELVHEHYKKADAFIFASTCETYGMVITEAMAAGLPIICSKYSSMPETVEDAGIYIDPLDVSSIKRSILQLYNNQSLRHVLGDKALMKSKTLSWENCASQTFHFLASVSREVWVE